MRSARRERHRGSSTVAWQAKRLSRFLSYSSARTELKVTDDNAEESLVRDLGNWDVAVAV